MVKHLVQRSCYLAAVAILTFAPGMVAQTTHAKTAGVTTMTAGAAVLTLDPWDPWGDHHHHDHVAAAEGGSAALYLLLAGVASCGAMVLRSRRARTEKSL